MTTDLVEHPLTSEVVFQGRLLDVRRDSVRLPDGTTSVREYIRHPGAVVIVAELENGCLLFERQYRYPVGRVMLELPAGKIDPGEPPLETARRELREETGYASDDWMHIGTMHPCIGYSDEHIEIYLARKAYRVGVAELDEGEFLECLELAPAKVRQAVLEGQLTDAKTITALYMTGY